jgi:hypothetical protein
VAMIRAAGLRPPAYWRNRRQKVSGNKFAGRFVIGTYGHAQEPPVVVIVHLSNIYGKIESLRDQLQLELKTRTTFGWIIKLNNGPISIVETRWWDDGNHSVRYLFEAIASIHYDNPSAFYYDMFSNRSSLQSILNKRCNDANTKVLYLATHGNDTEIGSDEDISRTEFRNDLVSANKKKQLSGLFLGTCYTGNTDTASFLLSGRTNLDWVAGYTQSVDWIDGNAIDMVFFHKLTQEYLENRKRRTKASPADMAKKAATELNKLIPGSHSKYGFNIYFRDGTRITSMFHAG